MRQPSQASGSPLYSESVNLFAEDTGADLFLACIQLLLEGVVWLCLLTQEINCARCAGL